MRKEMIIPLILLLLLFCVQCKKKLSCDEYTAMREEPASPLFNFCVIDASTEADLSGTVYDAKAIKVRRIILDRPDLKFEFSHPGLFKNSRSMHTFRDNILIGFEWQAYTLDYFEIYLSPQDSDTLMVKRSSKPAIECSHSLSFYHNGKYLLTHDYSYGETPELKLKK